MPRKNTRLSKTETAFFQSHGCDKRRQRVVRNFHAWLRRNGISIESLSSEHVEAYLRRPVHRVIEKSSRKRLYSDLKPYLQWLHAKGRLSFMPKDKRALPVPRPAADFIDTLRPVKKRATCLEYACQLRAFHNWLVSENLSLRDIDRNHIERWLQHLSSRKLSVVTRRHFIFHLKVYLEWLFEKELIDADPRELLRPTDIPKNPQYLPRPFPPEADQELQKRLAAGDEIHHKALLLMRKTGLRIGELLRLTPHCLEKDHLDNAFLKVPLGKLDNERLVPLDKNTRTLLETLQSLCPQDAEFLLLPHRSRGSLQLALYKTLKNIAKDLDTHGPAVSHRLRHTYATELINAGMNPVAIMRLLGHNCIQMTMRYAALTQITVARDYHAALAKIELRYQPSLQTVGEPDPERMLLDTIAWLRKNHDSNPKSRRASDAIIKRIHRIRQDISTIIARSDSS
jgi:site-specific recombinase XerD